MSDIPQTIDMSAFTAATMDTDEMSSQNHHTGTSVGSVEPKKPTRSSKNKFEVLRQELLALYGSAAMMLAPINMKDAEIIANHAEGIADAWITVARGNETVYRVLKSVCNTTAVGTVIALHASMLNQIAANHGLSLGSLLRGKHAEDQLSAVS